jgi:hypothetical protein
MVRSPEQWCDLRRRAHQRQLDPAGGADYQGGGHGAPQLGDIGPRRLSLGIVWLLAEVSTYAESRMSAFASFMRHAPSVWFHPAGRVRSTRARATQKSDVIVVGLGPSTGVSFSSSREPAGSRVDTPALCARAIRPDLPPTRMCRPSDETCLVFTVQSPWRCCRYSPRRSANDHRPPLGLSRVVVVGSRICRNRVTFAIPWPKRWRTW